MNKSQFAAINFISSSRTSNHSITQGKLFINNCLKITRVRCHILFLRICLKHRIIPNFFYGLFLEKNWGNDKCIIRKSNSLKLECIRVCLKDLETKEFELNRVNGYIFLGLQKCVPANVFNILLHMANNMMSSEIRLIFSRHCKKWSDLSNYSFPYSFNQYHSVWKPSFPFQNNFMAKFKHLDSINKNNDNANSTYDVSSKFTNNANILFSKTAADILSKGPKFCLPMSNISSLKNQIN
jgi:hypothetical protein